MWSDPWPVGSIRPVKHLYSPLTTTSDSSYSLPFNYHMIVLWILIPVVSKKIYGAAVQVYNFVVTINHCHRHFCMLLLIFPCLVQLIVPSNWLSSCVTAASLTCLKDPPRKGEKLTLSPSGTLAAITDSLGRILLLDTQALVVVRLWKVWSVYCRVISI